MSEPETETISPEMADRITWEPGDVEVDAPSPVEQPPEFPPVL